MSRKFTILFLAVCAATLALAQTNLARAASPKTPIGMTFNAGSRGFGTTFQNPSHNKPSAVNRTTTRSLKGASDGTVVTGARIKF
jgi:hypothetical protein